MGYVTDEKVYSIGFHKAKNKVLAFCIAPETSGTLFETSSKKDSYSEFGKNKKFIGLKHEAGKKPVIFTKNDFLSVSESGREKNLVLFNKHGKIHKLIIASSKNLGDFMFRGLVPGVKENGTLVPDFKYNKNYVLYYGKESVKIALSKDLKKWSKPKESVLRKRPGFFDKGDVEVITSIKISEGILILYNASVKENGNFKMQIGACLFSANNPSNIIWRSNEPLFEHESDKQYECKGAIFDKNQIFTYWTDGENTLVFSFYDPFSENFGLHSNKQLKRHHKNPIISPSKKDGWRTEGTFNPTAAILGGKIHLVYRTIGSDGVSRFGYARTDDGINISENYDKPIFAMQEPRSGIPESEKRYDLIMYPSGGSWGGSEDPKMVMIGDKVYITFNSFEGWDSIRIGLITLDKKDFKNKKWNWTGPLLISPPKEVHKNWALFPEKINGKFAIIHSISPKVQIEYVKNLEDLATGKQKIKSVWVSNGGPKQSWDTYLRGVGPAPVRTEEGWLVFYHATNKVKRDGYALGAMLLDLENPEKIIARSSVPILLPDMWYENEWKPGIVYACGSVVKDNTIYVYYGGGDKYVCVATAPLEKFLKDLKKNKQAGFDVKNVSFS